MLYYSIFSDAKVDQWVKSEVILVQKFHEWENEELPWNQILVKNGGNIICLLCAYYVSGTILSI